MTRPRNKRWRRAGYIFLLFLVPKLLLAMVPDSSLTIVLAGDIMLGRGVKRHIDTTSQAYPFELTSQLTSRADLAIANLESPLTMAEYRSTSPWRFRGDTSAAAAAIKAAGFDAVSLANNHALDCGPEGLAQTVVSLGSAGVSYAGIAFGPLLGADSSLCRLSVVTVRGRRVGLLAFCEPYLLKIAKEYGAALIPPADSAAVVGSIAAARGKCDLLICSFHWGREYQDHPTRVQRRLGRLAIDAGAKIVHGHHPHVLQGVEFYHGGLIAYSLGNYIFDQRNGKPRQSALLFVKLRLASSSPVRPSSVEVDSVSILPLEIVDNRPRPAALQAKAILKRLARLCRRIGTAAAVEGRRLLLAPTGR